MEISDHGPGLPDAELERVFEPFYRTPEARGGMVLLTSRVSVEMVQKAAAIGAPVMIAVSAPTALAVRTAEAAGITLIAIARQDGFEIFTHGSRIVARHATEVADVA